MDRTFGLYSFKKQWLSKIWTIQWQGVQSLRNAENNWVKTENDKATPAPFFRHSANHLRKNNYFCLIYC